MTMRTLQAPMTRTPQAPGARPAERVTVCNDWNLAGAPSEACRGGATLLEVEDPAGANDEDPAGARGEAS